MVSIEARVVVYDNNFAAHTCYLDDNNFAVILTSTVVTETRTYKRRAGEDGGRRAFHFNNPAFSGQQERGEDHSNTTQEGCDSKSQKTGGP